jgi:hypothetical protein
VIRDNIDVETVGVGKDIWFDRSKPIEEGSNGICIMWDARVPRGPIRGTEGICFLVNIMFTTYQESHYQP